MRVRNAAAMAVAVLAIAVPSGLDSCAIAPPLPVFATTQRPADIENQFLKGKLGVLQRSYGQRYLFGAFRMLSGVPLTKTEAQSLYSPPPSVSNGINTPPISDQWFSARSGVTRLGPAPKVEPYKTVSANGSISSFLNCQDDAFRVAAETLADLEGQWGDADPKTLDWVRAQDQVFANCAGAEPEIPTEPTTEMDPALAAHRRYQIAAACFYAGQFRKAGQAFAQIAMEKDSPWGTIAPYLEARALLRAGVFDGDEAAFRKGKDRLFAIMKDPGQSDWHAASLKLVHLWQLRGEPKARLAELSRELMRPGDQDIEQSVIDFLYLVNRRVDAAGKPLPESARREIEATSEVASWVLAMSQGPPEDAGERSVEWWRKNHSPAWLIAALANAAEKDLPELLQAARGISPDAPAYESVAYYAISRELARGHKEEARNWADRALSHNLLRSSRNLILAQRTAVARDWNEFLRFALRRPELKMEEFEGSEVPVDAAPIPTGTPPMFDVDVIAAFNAQAPLSLWVDASENTRLPGYMQLRIAEVGWVRAMLLGRLDEARKLMQRVGDLQPEAAQAAHGFLSASNPEEARFAALFIILRSPALGPQLQPPEVRTVNLAEAHYVGERCWICGAGMLRDHSVPTVTMEFLTPVQRAAAEAELKQIRAAEPWNPTYLTRETVAWAQKHPEDPRVPEALHRAVLSVRYRAADGGTSTSGEQAFLLLHRRYPKSPWTAKTKYWF